MQQLFTVDSTQNIQYELQEPCSKENIKQYFRNKKYMRVEAIIISGLHTFFCLNKHNLVRFIEYKVKDSTRKDYDSIINRLFHEGVITRFQYHDTWFYELLPGALEYAKEKYGSRRVLSDQEALSTRLETLSLAQWHISLLMARYKGTKQVFFQDKTDIPSLITCRIGKWNYEIQSLPIPKVKEHVERTVQLLRYIAEKKETERANILLQKKVYVTVLCGSTLDEIEKYAKLLSNKEELKHQKLYFTLDANTAISTGLTKLYMLEQSSKEDKLVVLSV